MKITTLNEQTLDKARQIVKELLIIHENDREKAIDALQFLCSINVEMMEMFAKVGWTMVESLTAKKH